MSAVTRLPLTGLEVYMKLIDLKRLKRLMIVQEVGVRELARAAGWSSHSYLSRMLRGKHDTLSIEPAVKIATYLHVGVEDLFVARVSPNPVQTASQRKIA